MIIALFEPDIPQNTGTILRLGACLGVAVHIVGPAAFPATEKAFRRAGLDYLDHVNVVNHVSFASFEDWRKQESRRVVLLSTKAASAHVDFAYRESDVLMCGRESAGVPEEVHRAADVRDRICAALEALENEAPKTLYWGAPARFERKAWQRKDHTGAPGGGGEAAVLRGRVFEKAGVHVSTVHGEFAPEFRAQIPGADNDPRFWASGVSAIVHPRNPHVPAVHLNTRYVMTAKSWFGGGSDLTPVLDKRREADDRDATAFHAAMKTACDRHAVASYGKYKAWCDEYFFLKHRNEPRGIGGIFFDYLESADWEADFAFVREVGLAFLEIYPALVRRNFASPWS